MTFPTTLIFIAVSGVISGQLCLKSGMSNIGKINNTNLNGIDNLIIKILSEQKVLLGLTFYGASSILWVYILSFTDLSYAFPFLSIAYVGVPTMAALVLHEQIPAMHWLGIILVVIGILLVATSN